VKCYASSREAEARIDPIACFSLGTGSVIRQSKPARTLDVNRAERFQLCAVGMAVLLWITSQAA